MEIQGLGANNYYQPQSQPKKESDEVTIASTDKVDAEIEKLKAKKANLEQKFLPNRIQTQIYNVNSRKSKMNSAKRIMIPIARLTRNFLTELT